MKITAKNKKMSLEWKIPRSCEATYPSLKKLKRGNTADAEDKLNGLWTLLKGCRLKGDTWDDPFGGIGTSAKLAYSCGMKVSVNELDTGLYNFLRTEYDEVTNEDADTLKMKPVSYRFFDRNHFTFNHLCDSFFESLLTTEKILLYTDVFPYSLKPYSRELLNQYLGRCDNWLKKTNWGIQKVFLYRNTNVMIVKAKKNYFKKQIIEIEKEPRDRFDMTVDIGLFG